MPYKPKERPGVMLFFDKVEPLLILGDEKLGAFFRAILRYSRYGEAPEFSGMEAVYWEALKSSLDSSADNYAQTVEHNRLKGRYSAYKRSVRADGKKPIPFEEWISGLQSGAGQVQPQLTDVDSGQPASANNNPNSNPNPNPNNNNNKKHGSGRKKKQPAHEFIPGVTDVHEYLKICTDEELHEAFGAAMQYEAEKKGSEGTKP